MSEHHTYCVFFHPQALDVLGEAVAPYLSEGPAGKFLLCREIDTGGNFCEIELIGTAADGKPLEVELMIPTGMIRLVISTSASETEFGFA
jgi:hypothetical protein